MSITAPDILVLAKQICELSSEAGNRSAISRSYYSVYHGCLEWEKSFPNIGSNSGPQGGVHQQLINRLRNPAPELKDDATRGLSRRIAARLDALRTKRKAADYLLDTPNHTNIDAANCCAQAADVLGKITVAPAAENEPDDPPQGPTPPSSPPPSTPRQPEQPSGGGARPALKRVR